MKNILVTGANGQLGNELKLLAENQGKNQFFFTDVKELDITDSNAVTKFIASNEIYLVVNCAAYTAVDKAEEERELAERINVSAVKNLVDACNESDATLLNISTDYVFDGTNHKPYLESEKTKPGSFYGLTKENGEKEIIKHANKGIIIRTSWLYSSFGHNFVKTIIKYGIERDELSVVCDQIGTPTYAADLAKCIIQIIDNYKPEGVEIFNFSNQGVCSWYDFAEEIVELKQIDCKVKPIESKDYPTPTKRPFYSVLNKTKISDTLNIEIPHWKESLKKCLEKL